MYVYTDPLGRGVRMSSYKVAHRGQTSWYAADYENMEPDTKDM